MTIAEAQRRVDLWIKSYGVRYFNELTNMAVLTEEVGELARIMARNICTFFCLIVFIVFLLVMFL